MILLVTSPAGWHICRPSRLPEVQRRHGCHLTTIRVLWPLRRRRPPQPVHDSPRVCP